MFSLVSRMLLVTFLLGAVAPVQAQTSSGQSQRQGNGRMRRMLSQLNLTQDQLTQIRALKGQPKGKARRQAFMAILTADQKSQLRTMMRQRLSSRKSSSQSGPASTNFSANE